MRILVIGQAALYLICICIILFIHMAGRIQAAVGDCPHGDRAQAALVERFILTEGFFTI